MPVNFVFVAEGEEEIGSPHFGQIVHKPEIEKALSKCAGFSCRSRPGPGRHGHDHPWRERRRRMELTSNGEKWGRGPLKDIHSSNKARVDSPAWHLVQALNTLVSRGWKRSGDRRPNEKCAAAQRGGKIDDRRPRRND